MLATRPLSRALLLILALSGCMVPLHASGQRSPEPAKVLGRKRVIDKAAPLDLMVLQTVDGLGPVHGYAIAARLQQTSNGALQLNMGTLYPALMRLEQRGLLKGAWGVTDTNR